MAAAFQHVTDAAKLLRQADRMKSIGLLEDTEQNKLIDALQHLLLALYLGDKKGESGVFDFHDSFLFDGRIEYPRHALVSISSIIIRLARNMIDGLTENDRQQTALRALKLARLAHDLLFSTKCRRSLSHCLIFQAAKIEMYNYRRWKACYLEVLDVLSHISVAFQACALTVETQKVISLWKHGEDAMKLWDPAEPIPSEVDCKDFQTARNKLQKGIAVARAEQDQFAATLFGECKREPDRPSTNNQTFASALKAFEEDIQLLENSADQTALQRTSAAKALRIRFHYQIQQGLAHDITRLDKYMKLQQRLHNLLTSGHVAAAGKQFPQFPMLVTQSQRDKQAFMLHYAYKPNSEELEEIINFFLENVVSKRSISESNKRNVRQYLKVLLEDEGELDRDFFDCLMLAHDEKFSKLKPKGRSGKMPEDIIRKLDPVFARQHFNEVDVSTPERPGPAASQQFPIEISDDEEEDQEEDDMEDDDEDEVVEVIPSSAEKKRRLKRNSSEVKADDTEEDDEEGLLPSSPVAASASSAAGTVSPSQLSTPPSRKKQRIYDSDDED